MYLNKIIPYEVKEEDMANIPINMFIKMFSAAILRLSDLKDELLKDLENATSAIDNKEDLKFEKIL